MQVLPRRIASITNGKEKQPTIMAGTVRFGPDHDCRMKRIEDVSVRQNESDDLRFSFSIKLEVQVRGCLQNATAQCGGNSVAACSYARNRRDADAGRLRHILDRGSSAQLLCLRRHIGLPKYTRGL